MKFLITFIFLFLSSTVFSETFDNVDDLYKNCKDVINSINNNNDFSFFYEQETKADKVVSAGMCIGYFAGIVEGHQIGWSSADFGNEYCDNSKTIFEIISIFENDYSLKPEAHSDNVRPYLYDLMINQICN